MFKWLSCCAPADVASAPAPADPAQEGPAIARALEPGAVAVVSIACCMPGSSGADDAVLAAVSDGLRAAGRADPVVLVPAMEAQRFAMAMPSGVDARARRVVEQVMALFTQQGMGVFPIVVIDRRIAFYGGVPGVEQVADRVRTLVPKREAA